MKRTRQALHGKEITANFTHAEAISPEHVADRFGRPVDLLRYVFDGTLNQFLSNDLQFGFCPSSVVLPSLDPVLDDQAPASLLGAPSVTLKAHYKLFEFVARKHLGLSRHGHNFGTPLAGPL
ncbi:MAG: hypothetical protein WA826_17985 [Silvibacterium sp.]